MYLFLPYPLLNPTRVVNIDREDHDTVVNKTSSPSIYQIYTESIYLESNNSRIFFNEQWHLLHTQPILGGQQLDKKQTSIRNRELNNCSKIQESEILSSQSTTSGPRVVAKLDTNNSFPLICFSRYHISASLAHVSCTLSYSCFMN